MSLNALAKDQATDSPPDTATFTAQIISPADLLRSPSNPIIPENPIELKVPDTKPQISPKTPTSPDALEDASDTIRVDKFEFVGSTVFSQAELERVIENAICKKPEDFNQESQGIDCSQKPFQVTFAQLLQARSAITQHYIDKGYITSGAYIPEQNLYDGTGKIRIKILEGSLETKEINREITFDKTCVEYNQISSNNGSSSSNNDPDKERINIKFVKGVGIRICQRKNAKRRIKWSEDHVRNRLFTSILGREIKDNKPLQKDTLLKALQLLQNDSQVERLDAELLPGNNPGRNLLMVTVYEKTLPCTAHLPSCLQVELTSDNNRSPSVGSVNRQLRLNLFNSIGEGDDLSVAFTNTNGSNAVDLVAILPTTTQWDDENLRFPSKTVIFRFNKTWNNIIERPFNRLDINSTSHLFDVGLRLTGYRTLDSEFSWIFGGSWQQSSTTLLDIPIPLSRDANDQGETRVPSLRGGLEWVKRTSRSALALRGELRLGANLGAKENFAIGRGEGLWLMQFAPETRLLARFNVQLASGPLPALEQAVFGGLNTLRGYRQNFLLGDNGINASVELQLPVPKLGKIVQITPFVDFTTAWNWDRKERERLDIPSLWSTGVGVQVNLNDRFKARIDWGIPLVTTDSRGENLPLQKVYFSVFFQLPNF